MSDDWLSRSKVVAKAAPAQSPAADDWLSRSKIVDVNPPANPDGLTADSALGYADTAMRGVAGGALLGSADEATAALGGLYQYGKAKLGLRGDISLPDAYHTTRDAIRRADAEAQARHPYVSLGANIAGGIGSTIAGGALVKGLTSVPILAEAGPASTLVPKLSFLDKANKAGKIGAAYGAAGGVGNANEFTDIPAEAIRGAGTGYATGFGISALGQAVVGGVKKIPEVLANVFGGVSPKNLNEYVQNADRINQAGAMSEEAIKDAVDTQVAKVHADSAELAGKAGDAEHNLNQAYAAKQAEIVGSVTPLAKAKEMTAALAAQKGYLGTLSEQADDALARSGAVFKKADLLKSVDKIGFGQGTAIGDEAHSALAKLQATRDRISAQLPDEIPAVQMRDVLKQLRKDVNFDMGAGEFNDTLNGMRREFSGEISGALKKKAPEYAKYMERMSDLADNLGTMNRYFGDETKALGSLEALRRGGTRGQLIEDALQNHAKVNADQTLLDHLSALRDNHALLSRIKSGEDLRPEFFPKEWNALQEANANAAMGADVAGGIGRLSPNSTQAILKNQGGNNVSIENTRALENLKNTSGIDYRQMSSDKGVANAFTKGAAQGSRMAVMGGTAGGAIGYRLAGPTGAAAGAAIGSTAGGALDRYGPAVVKSLIDNTLSLQAWVATNGPRVKGPASQIVADAINAAKNGDWKAAAAYQAVLRTDPIYRAAFGTDNHQQSKDNAVSRRLQGNQ